MKAIEAIKTLLGAERSAAVDRQAGLTSAADVWARAAKLADLAHPENRQAAAALGAIRAQQLAGLGPRPEDEGALAAALKPAAAPPSPKVAQKVPKAKPAAAPAQPAPAPAAVKEAAQ